MTHKKVMLFLFITALLISSAALGQKIEEKDGIKYIHNDKEGIWDKAKKPKLELTPVRSWGELESDDENLQFYKPLDIEQDSKGNIYILDSGNNRIQKFDKDGNFIKSIGQKGKGPGEFQFATDIALDKDDNIYISDGMNQRIQILESDGTFISSFKPEYGPGNLAINSTGEIYIGGGGFVSITMTSSGGSIKMPEKPLLAKYDREGKLLEEIGKRDQFKNMMLQSRGNRIAYTLAKDESIYLNYNIFNKIKKLDNAGNTIFTADRKLRFKPKKVEDKKGSGIERIGSGAFSISFEVDEISRGIALDDKENIFVITVKRKQSDKEKPKVTTSTSKSGGGVVYRSAAPSYPDIVNTDRFLLEVFNKEGILLTTKQLENFVDTIKIIGNRFYLIDTNRSMKIYEFELVYEGI